MSAPHPTDRAAPAEMPPSTAALYDAAAADWRRDEPVLLSDFTARPALLDWCTPLDGLRVLDAGCGEGYVARRLAERGAASVLGIDVSAEMIARAQAAEDTAPKNIEYCVGDAAAPETWRDVPARGFDLAVAVFLFNYLDIDAMRTVLCHLRRALAPGGRLVFSVPHPALPFLGAAGRTGDPQSGDAAARFHFQAPADAGWFSARDRQFEGHIARRDGGSVPVRCIHKTFADYFSALRDAGFTLMPEIQELHVTASHVQLDPDFFGPLVDRPLHLAFRLDVPR